MAQTQKPNIIFILGDDIGYKTLTVNGGNSYSTPHLDSMARNGMNFTQCHSSPLCSPSRFMLLTGKYNFRNYTEWGNMDTSQKTIGNMFKDAGYKTACFGKWQLNGGDFSIHQFGFDSYCVWDAVDPNISGARYKSPKIYTNGRFVADSLINGKYGEDIFSDSVINFIEQNNSVPFFIYYPMVLAHEPFQATPDDDNFITWNNPKKSDTSYYSSMIRYMDKKIGLIIQKVKDLGIENNTVIIYAGDNGTPTNISEYVNDDSLVTGGKAYTTESGTHVPLIIYWPGTIQPGSINNNLIDFTDFLPTLADITNVQKPVTYGVLDGVSFATSLSNNEIKLRDWIFLHYDHHPGISKPARWAQTETYKLYDTSATKPNRLFYNIKKDASEKKPISDNLVTQSEDSIKQMLLSVINGYVSQGLPIFRHPVLSHITDSSVVITDSIQINGGSTITASGAVWSTIPNPEIISSPYSSDGKLSGLFQSAATKLKSGTTYYIRVYATNYAGTAYGKQISFKTLSHAPVATEATLIDSNKFIANWKSISGRNNYSLDISTYPTFNSVKSMNLTQGFANGLTPPADWFFTNNLSVNNNNHGVAKPSLTFTTSNTQIITKPIGGIATQLKFWIKGLSTNAASSFLIEGFNGNIWVTIKKLTNISTSATTKIFNASSNPALPPNITQFRFTYTKSAGTIAFDDVSINYNATSPSFVQGYNNLTVTGTSKLITGLATGTNYYYRVRSGGTANSNVITTTTCKRPVITNLNLNNITCTANNDGSISPIITGGVGTFTYNWTGPNNFTSSSSNISSLAPGTYKLTMNANGGCAMDTTVVITQPSALSAAASADAISCAGGTTRLTVNATGGTGNYHYTLSNGTNTTSPQDDNHFTVTAGNYTVRVEDDNHCSFTTSAIQITEPTALNATTNADEISCASGTTILTVNATGGTGNYQYTLSDGTNTTGPQDDNHFTVGAGSYTALVEDDNHCSFTTSAIQVTEPTALNATTNADAITCVGGTTILTVNATGGTENYHYTLSDGTNTTGLQDDNHFTVGAGSYSITITDDNGCTTTIPAFIADGADACNGIISANTESSSQKIKVIAAHDNLSINAFPNPTLGEFLLEIKTTGTEKIKIYVTDVYGRRMYQSSGEWKEKYSFGKQFSAGIYFMKVMQGRNFKTLKLIKEK